MRRDMQIPGAPFIKNRLDLIPARISHYIYHKVWDKMAFPFLNVNDVTVEVKK